MRKVKIFESILEHEILPSEILSGHRIKNVSIKNGQVFNGFIVIDKEENDEYFKLISTKRLIIEIISNEDFWDTEELVDLCPSNKESYFYIILNKQNLENGEIKYILKYSSHVDNYEHCKCDNCNSIIEYIDKYCKYCGDKNCNRIPIDDYDNAIEFLY
jgi:DNA-directed RNA polymerase subunit F